MNRCLEERARPLAQPFSYARSIFFILSACVICDSSFAQRWDALPDSQTNGTFWSLHWYERGLTNGNPKLESRFRANSPEVVLHPTYGKREEARANGLMLILAEEDLSLLTAAELYLETWGGHPGTANKRVTVNGRSTYALTRVGTEEKNCTYSYPSLPLKISDLVNGWNAFQFAVDQGTTFWGHMIIDNACLRESLKRLHPDLQRVGLGDFDAAVKVGPEILRDDILRVELVGPEEKFEDISSVDFQAWYSGYDENGNTLTTDWHGFTTARQPVAHLGTVTNTRFAAIWNTSLLPAQKPVAVRAVVHFKAATSIVYLTSATCGVEIPERAHAKVALYHSSDLPHPMWSRAREKKKCTIELDIDPSQIERAELHVNAWTGGAGTVSNYFTLNGHFFPVAEGSRHEMIYSRLTVDPKILKRGANQIELLSDTEHHGIEILLPGPCLMLRHRTSD